MDLKRKNMGLIAALTMLSLGMSGCSAGNAGAEHTDINSGTAAQDVVTENTVSSDTSDNTVMQTNTVKTEVVAAVNSEPGSGWDPLTGYGQRYDPILQSTLTKAYGGEITNDLAVGYEVNDDGTEWRFTIRDDAYYSNGDKVTASDVAFTYLSVRDNGTSLDLSNMNQIIIFRCLMDINNLKRSLS